MSEMYEYRAAVAELLSATIREVIAGEELSAACEEQGSSNSEWLAAQAQQKRQAVYSADSDREEAAERFVRWWRRVGGDPTKLNVEVSA